MIKVAKFGGSSLADAAQFRKVADIIRQEPSRRYIVVSAPGKRFSGDIKVTDLLYQCYDLFLQGKNIDSSFRMIQERFQQIIDDLGLTISLEQEFEDIKTLILHHVGRDYLASRGEYLNGLLLANYLGFTFVGAENGIFFREDGSFDDEKTQRILSEILKREECAVIPGFYGSMPNGTIKTFTRGGSDITGSIVAKAVRADMYENWTDVSGMLMADPHYVKNPKPMTTITYQELRELAYMGATVMHEDAIFPVREEGIPINIRNTNCPEHPGTKIVPYAQEDAGKQKITGIAGKTGFTMITIEKANRGSHLNFAMQVMTALQKYHLSFEHYLAGIDTLSVVVNTQELLAVKEDLSKELFRTVNPEAVSMDGELALIAVVGRGMISESGMAGRVFHALGKESVNIRMIQDAFEMNIIIGVSEKDYVPAIQAIYNEFVPYEDK